MTSVPVGKYAEIGGGLRVHYHEAGEGDAVVFFHGSGPGASGWSNFRGNYPYLAERGFRAIVPDTIGYGYSSKPADMPYTLANMAGAMRRFLSAIGVERASLIGNSMGGALAIQLALDHPDLVRKLVLMAPGGLEQRETYMKMKGIQAMMRAFFDPAGVSREGMVRTFGLQLFDPSLLTDALVDERLSIAVTQPKEVIATMQVPFLAPELPRLRCPVLGFWGLEDQFCPVSGAMTLATGCADSTVILMSRCGHWVMVEHAARFNRATADFLGEP